MTSIRLLTTAQTLAPALERAATAALMLLAMTFAFESTHPLLRLGPMILTNVEVLLFVTVGLWAAARVASRRRPAVPRVAVLPAVAWLAALAVSALLAPAHRFDAIKFVGRMAGAVVIAWAAYDLSCAGGHRTILARALALGGLLVGALGIAEALEIPAVMRFLAAFKEAPTFVGEIVRISSTLAYATIASMIIELTVPLLVVWLVTARRPATRVALGAGLLASLAAQALTLTRGGLVALLAALGTMAAWAAWRRQKSVLAGSALTGAVLLLLWGAILIWNPVARYRLVSETEERWYQATYQAPAQLTLAVHETAHVQLTVTNTGARTWHAQGDHAFALGYHLVHPDGTIVDFDAGHFALPQDVAPGASVRVLARITAPATRGDYVMEWDVLQEDVTWFSWEGVSAGRTRLEVTRSAAGGAAVPYGETETDEPLSPPTAALTASEEGRLWLWRVAASMLVERPLFGVGPDNFRWLHAAHAGVDEADTRIHANNLYVEWLVDTGIVGFAAFAWLTWTLVRAAYLALRESDGATRRLRDTHDDIWQIAIATCLLAWFAHGLLDFFYEFTPTYLAFALLCGLLFAHPVLVADLPDRATRRHHHQEGRTCASDSM